VRLILQPVAPLPKDPRACLGAWKKRKILVRIKNWVLIIRLSIAWSSHCTLSPSRSPCLTTPKKFWLRSITFDRPTDILWAEGIKQVATYIFLSLSPLALRKSRNAGVHKFSPKKESRDQPQNSRHQKVLWSESLTEGPKILGSAVRNLFVRNDWLPPFVHPGHNANPDINLTKSVGRSTWQGWHEKLFRPYLIIVCCVSIHFHLRTVLLFFCYSLSLWSCLYVCVLRCWCHHTGRQFYMTLSSELYISTVFVHGNLHCYFV
jgi:hypothetical protein